MVKLSIITVNLNNRDGLKKTIDSVVSQTFRDFEWIVIDGGSTDGSRELIEHYADHFAYWVSEPDKGVYNAMNKGIKVANGEYLQFLNSGDWLCDEKVLEKVFGKERNAEILYGYMLVDEIAADTPASSAQYGNIALMKPALYWDDFIGDTLPHQSTFIKKSLFERIGLYDETYRIAADNKFFIKAIVWEKASYEFIPEHIARFQQGGISSSTDRFEERDVRLCNEMFPKMVMDDYPLVVSLRKIRKHKLLKKCYTLLSLVVDKLEKRGDN